MHQRLGWMMRSQLLILAKVSRNTFFLVYFLHCLSEYLKILSHFQCESFHFSVFSHPQPQRQRISRKCSQHNWLRTKPWRGSRIVGIPEFWKTDKNSDEIVARLLKRMNVKCYSMKSPRNGRSLKFQDFFFVENCVWPTNHFQRLS